MAKKRSASSARARRAIRSGKPIPDSQIDFTDIPESTDAELRRARRVGRPKTGRPARQLIAIRIDPLLLSRLRALAARQKKPYQSFIHELLEQAAKPGAIPRKNQPHVRWSQQRAGEIQRRRTGRSTRTSKAGFT